MARRGNRDNDGKYLRLTGLWPSKKNNALWSGKIRNQDIGVLQDKIQEADDSNSDIVVFLWENTDRRGKKDPEFTVQISVSEDEENGHGRGRSSGGHSSRRDRDEVKDEENDDNNEEDNEEPEEKETRRSTRGAKAKGKEESRSRRSGASSKKDKNDW